MEAGNSHLPEELYPDYRVPGKMAGHLENHNVQCALGPLDYLPRVGGGVAPVAVPDIYVVDPGVVEVFHKCAAGLVGMVDVVYRMVAVRHIPVAVVPGMAFAVPEMPDAPCVSADAPGVSGYTRVPRKH